MSSAQNATEPAQSQAHTASSASFEAALVLNAAVFGAELLAFTLIRRYFKSIYEPRTFLTPQNKRVPPLSDKLFGWPLAVYNADFREIARQNGLDAYMFVRFLRMMVKILLPIWILSWAILLPVTSVNTSVNNHTGLDRFTFGNVGLDQQPRYAAHVILAWLFTLYILYVLRYELREFITSRQRHLVDPLHSASAQANTVLVTGVPQKYLSEAALTHLFSHVPGGVRKVWLNRDLKKLPDIYNRRLAACNKLESAENALLKTAAKLYRKKHPEVAGKEKEGPSRNSDFIDMERRGSDLDEADRLVPRKKRPTHRLPVGFIPFSLPLIGKQVDSIDWARAEIVETNKILADERAVLDSEARDTKEQRPTSAPHSSTELLAPDADPAANLNPNPNTNTNSETDNADANVDTSPKPCYPALNSAFILFHQQIGAHIAAQTLTHNEPFRMAAKYTEVAPADVVWGNLGLNPYEASVRRVGSYAVTAGLIILWAIPVAFVGIVSNIAGLCSTYHWLAWLCTLPSAVTGIIQGILPPVLLAVLFMLLPIVLRLLARFEGIPTRTGIELSLMTRFFIFQVVHGFLIVTISSGIIAALPGLVSNPGSIPTLLAQKLPSASTFFLTYIILQGLSGTAGGFLTIVPLVIYYVKLTLLGSTPRSIYNIKYTLRNVAWGTTFPGVTLLAVITLGYSIISPIINGLAFATFFLFYMLYKYLFLWQLDMPAAGDTGGLFFPKAIQHVFVGLYIQQICLAALFFLARDAGGKASAVPEGIVMIVLVVITAFYNYILNSSYAPLLHALPLSLADKSYGMPKHEHGAVEERLGDGSDTGSRSETAAGKAKQAEAEAEAEREVTSDELDGPHRRSGHRNRDGSGPTDFAHPAAVEPQRPIWIASDSLGLARVEEKAMREEGVRVSTEGAVMDGKGHVEIDGRVPEGEDQGESV